MEATKAAQPRYIEMAEEISREMINNFSSKEQREMLQIVSDNIEKDYSRKIEELKRDLETITHHKDTFLGNPTDIKEGPY